MEYKGDSRVVAQIARLKLGMALLIESPVYNLVVMQLCAPISPPLTCMSFELLE